MSDWISVKDRLPEDGKLVLAVNENGTYDVCYWNGQHWFDKFGHMIFEKSHWQPLTPPKEDK